MGSRCPTTGSSPMLSPSSVARHRLCRSCRNVQPCSSAAAEPPLEAAGGQPGFVEQPDPLGASSGWLTPGTDAGVLLCHDA